jgi:hypothetical protein
MNSYRYIGGFKTHAEASDYAARLPKKARAKVVPYMIDKYRYLFAVDVDRFYLDKR